MIPHKTKRGMEASNRLKVFEGIPPPYDKVVDLVHAVEVLWVVLCVIAAKADGGSSSTESVEAETRKKGKIVDLICRKCDAIPCVLVLCVGSAVT